MADIEHYLRDHDKNAAEATAAACRSANRLATGDLTLIRLVTDLGEHLNSEHGATRATTMAYLAEVLAAVTPTTLSLQQRNLLCDFVLSRTEDSVGLGSCAKTLLALGELGKWDDQRAVDIVEALLANTNPLRKVKLQSERYSVLRLIDALLAKYRHALRSHHDSTHDFMPRFIAYFDGEKDPRNLMVVFSILRVPMTEWSVSAYAQDLFDAVFNYFPITFRPPPDDPYGITAQDLKDRLRECLSSTAEFAPYAFPALLDKLDSTSMNTKRDVLSTITASVSAYGPRTAALHSITLWDALKFEILNVQEEDLAQQALTGLAAIAKTLSQGTPGPLNAYLRPIVKECNEYLEDAPTKQSQAAARILYGIADVSPDVTNILLAGVLPTLFRLFETSETMAKRRGLLEVLAQLVRATIHVYGDWTFIGPGGEKTDNNILAQFREQAVEIMLNGLEKAPSNEVSFRLVCLDGLIQLSKVRQLLSNEDQSRIIHLLHSIVIYGDPYGKDEVGAAAINGIVDIAHQKPQVVIDDAFPAFLAQLPDTDSDGIQSYPAILEAFAKLASEEQVFDTVVLRLKNKFGAAVSQGATSTYIVALLSALFYALQKGEKRLSQISQASSYYKDIALPLLQRVSSPESSHPTAFDDEKTLELVGRICNLIIRSQTAEHQNAIAMELYTLFRDQSQVELPPFKINAAYELQKTMIVSTYLLASFRRDTPLPCELQDLILSLVRYSQQFGLRVSIRSACLRQISLAINKFCSSSALKSCMDSIMLEFDLMNADKLDPHRIRIIFACLRGIVLRSSPLLGTLYPSLLSLLSHPQYGSVVAQGFQTLLQPDDLLSKPNHCQILGLHKQKTFALLVPSITAAFKAADAATKPNYLIALSGALRWMPFGIIVEDVGQLVTLLLQSLDLDGSYAVKEAALATITSTLREKPQVLEEHAGSLISRLLANATRVVASNAHKPPARPLPPPSVRSASLKCLHLAAETLREETLARYRREVVRRLAGALDDGRRGVRSEAVRCRSRWLDGREDDDDD